MSTKSQIAPSSSELADRLAKLRSHMQKKGASWCVIRATDPYLNEYVPEDQSRRVFITGFTGSMGDALVGLQSATLFVDGRYALQAKDEAVHFDVKVLPLGVSIEASCLNALEECAKGSSVLIEEDRVSKTQFDRLSESAKEHGYTLLADPGIADEVRFEGHEIPKPKLGRIWEVESKVLGTKLTERLSLLKTALAHQHVDAFLLVALDDIAWLSGFRGSDFAYQSTFASRAIAFKNEIWMVTPHQPKDFTQSSQLRFFEKFEHALLELAAFDRSRTFTIGYDPDSTPASLLKPLQSLGVTLKSMNNPVQDFKVHKCKSEIDHMYSAYARADKVVFETQNWVCDQVMSGKKITEADVSDHVRARFMSSGTVELSFKPICGYAKNGAIIHHGTPDDQIAIKEGEIFLLDTGGIYEAGYSTDLTRTFLVGGPKTQAIAAHKQMFTLVLKGAITGMSARMPDGFTGVQLDALVRAPFWQLGLNYAHGTGHGIGINVHEFPPRVATFGHAKIEVGHVFSIEPGLYITQFGGVRIENLCTVVNDPVKKGFLRVIPLTFAPLDDRLIDLTMLTQYERAFLDFFKKRFDSPEKDWNMLPPLDQEPSELMRIVPKS